MDVLKNIFGGGDPDDHEQRAQRYQQGYSSGQYDDLDEQDVQERYRRTVQHAPPEVVEEAHLEAFRRLPPQERQRILSQFQQVSSDPRAPFTWGGPMDDSPEMLARMAGQARQQQPDMLQNLGGMLSNPMAKMAMAGVAAYAAPRIMGGGPGSGGRNRIL
jgi:hypothetical protein